MVLQQIIAVLCCLSTLTVGWRMPYLGQNLEKMGIVRNKNYDTFKQKVEADMDISKKSDVAKAYEDGFRAALAHNVPYNPGASAIPAQVMNYFQTSQVPDAQTSQINKVAFFDPLLTNGREEKRNRIAAPLPRNYYENVFPGFKMQNVPENKVAPLTHNAANRIETREASHVQTEKRAMIERLNYAARHRNVIFDSVSAGPSGGTAVLSRSKIIYHRKKNSKRSTIDDDNEKQK